jgi:Zn-finger nucleic acid-binding protein
MAYRDAVAACPRCHLELRRRRRRDIWRCLGCGGVHLSAAELERWLGLLAPARAAALVAEARAMAGEPAAVGTAAAKDTGADGAGPEASAEPGADRLACPTCTRPLRRVALAGVPARRCAASGELWFEGPRLGELFAVLDGERRASLSWLSRLLEHFFVS